MIRLIASDLDGTLLTSIREDGLKHVSPRTLAVLQAARDAGVLVVPASGRQPFSIGEVLAGTFMAHDIVLGANGAIGANLGTGEVFFEHLLSVEAQTATYEGLVALYPGVRCVSIRDGGESFVPQRGYTGLMDPGDHGRTGDMPEFDLADVLAEPSLKFIVRDPAVDTDELLVAARSLAIPGAAAVTSGAPFVEVNGAGVDKGSGLASLCASLGIDASEVVAFGDALNDVEMLQWAGLGVAMGNAEQAVKDVADEVTATNDEDGLALVLERLLSVR